MTNEEIIDGLKFTMDMCLFSSVDGSKRPISMLNDLNKITYNACEGAIKLLEQTRWIPVTERLPEKTGIYLISIGDLVASKLFDGHNFRTESKVRFIPDAWMPLPQPYKECDTDEHN